MYRLLLPFIFSASVLGAKPISLPSNFKVCSRNAPNFNDCLKLAIQSGITELTKGSKPLGVLPIDPLLITKLAIHQGEGPVAINLDFTNPTIIGIEKITIESVDAQLNGNVKTLSLKMFTTSSLALVGEYEVAGKVLVLPISGKGNSKIELVGAQSTITFTGKTVENDGNTYLVLKTVNLTLDPKAVKLHFENLFNGDKALGDNMNAFLNERSMDVYEELKIQIQKAFASTFIEIANRIFTKVPYDTIFPK